jgi:hypothetical protein
VDPKEAKERAKEREAKALRAKEREDTMIM